MTDLDSTSHAVCVCGKAITKFLKSGKPYTYCSERCKWVAAKRKSYMPVGERSFVCVTCEQPFLALHKRKYCKPGCGRKTVSKSPSKRPKNVLPRDVYLASARKAEHYFNCEHCGKASYRKLSGTSGSPNRFCSMRCRVDAAATIRLARQPAPFTPYYCKVCVTCNVPFAAKTDKTNCSRSCELLSMRLRSHSDAIRQHKLDARVVVCDECSCRFSPLYGSSHATLCVPCLEQRKRAWKRIQRMRRKAMQRGAQVESVNPIKVFERDGWCCKLCGVKTPKGKRGTHDSDAPELDHIIPLSLGGDHSYLNTQCACRKCNGLKSNKPMGQLLLIG